MTSDGGPAFPCEVGNGMSLRDYFAAAALQGILPALHEGIRPVDVLKMASDCFGIADAMLMVRAARKRKDGE